jgi:hypothetical protein
VTLAWFLSAIFDIDLEPGTVIQAIINIAVLGAVARFFSGVGRGFEIPVPVVPGNEHIFSEAEFRLLFGQ